MEHILLGREYRYKIAQNEKNQLTMTCASFEQTVSQTVLTAQPCVLFSADADEKGVVHIACVTKDTLTYLRHSGGKTNTTHLMRLPDGFTVTGVCLQAGGDVHLYYCVKSREGNAVICYTLSGDAWQGANLLTTTDPVRLLCAGKEREDCLIERGGQGGLSLSWARQAQGKRIPLLFPAVYAQACGDTAVYGSGESVFVGEKHLMTGEAVYVLDRERLLVRQGDMLREVSASGRLLGQSRVMNGAREYLLCEPGREKRLILSAPFPYLRLERDKAGSGLAQEVYMQQRAMFSLQAEVRELKQRLKRLEEERKR